MAVAECSKDIRTYSVVTLNEECGFIEWVPNTVGLRQILHQLYHARGIALYVGTMAALPFSFD